MKTAGELIEGMEPGQSLVAQSQTVLQLKKQADDYQLPVLGAFANVFERLGAEEWLYDVAKDNPLRFLTLLVKLAPPAPPPQSHSGPLKIVINNSLGKTDLDSEIKDITDA